MDTTENITFTSKLTFWDKFKCFYLLHLYSLISLYNAKMAKNIGASDLHLHLDCHACHNLFR